MDSIELKKPAPCVVMDRTVSLHEPGITIHPVPVVKATAESFARYGRIVHDFESEQIIIKPWPAQGWRPVEKGTGDQGGTVEDEFIFYRDGDCMVAHNLAVDGHYVTGWFCDPVNARESGEPSISTQVYIREANYHPDGGQLFYPQDGQPFIALLALPGDDVQPEDFVGFYCDGSFGIQIFPDIWHQPVFPLSRKAVYQNRQGRVHACVAVDFVTEFSTYLSLDLKVPA
ncbi:ureidoglycolate lyase [Parendozoicomonas haliclonae]|uniref:Ureidoglycolate hydrolase n=1 Tax=Parendozoicomonas haliclonae TaxID=1960125 RepID=A0A1X7APM8_9GAMM|nr:ureidoglycolate lyase [Parendozoicomonas haliclonae]SMA50281.1 ureidoglycolate hydrolase [Parendozoicomonas haliclonae]